ncbi:MAG: hypothetical protein V4497_05715, partial [Bacteroidota bacterium]
MENNTISTKLKRWQTYCHTFICCCKTVLTGFYWTKTFSEKLFFYGSLILLTFTMPYVYGQGDVGSSAVKANFGIDGDVYANRLQFSVIPIPNLLQDPLPAAAGTDDWFINTGQWPGSGLGVIDQHLPIPAGNVAFERRQSITTPTAPFPYPIVPPSAFPWTGSYLWLDSVYGRDTYVQGGNAETSYFGGSGDKNSDNPNTWKVGTSGSVPQKDDIIDVYAHLRGEGIRIPSMADPRPFTTLWGYAGASLVVTNGNKHLDFEFFRTGAILNPTGVLADGTIGPVIENTGTDGGRTAWTFNADGSIAIPGTIIISTDYINGGNVPSIRIRVWMSQATFNAYNNALAARPFNVDTTVAFELGTGSGTFGYAAINPKSGGVSMWGRVNDDKLTDATSLTLGPPWGTYGGSTPDAVTSYARYQFVEIGINLTAFGLDARGSQDACSNLLGSLLVKTRSSGGGPNEGAFGSELKDFVGPFLFGNTGNPPTFDVANIAACGSGNPVTATVNLTTNTHVSADGGTIHYFTDSGFLDEIPANPGPAAYVASSGTQTIYVRSEKLGNPGCFGENHFDVTVNPSPNVTTTPLGACESGSSGQATFTLNSGVT